MDKTSKFIIFAIFLLIAVNVAANYVEEAQVDSSKLPGKVEESNGFQRWITNNKKRMDISADDFNLKDVNEVYNATFLEITRLEGEKNILEHETHIKSFEGTTGITISPDSRELIDYTHSDREDYSPYEARFFGLREDKLIDTKILSCVREANCYFDRAYFLDNHSFVISEISRNDVDRKNVEANDFKECGADELCTYTFKLHLIDLLKNTRTVYETSPFDKVLTEMIQFF